MLELRAALAIVRDADWTALKTLTPLMLQLQRPLPVVNGLQPLVSPTEASPSGSLALISFSVDPMPMQKLYAVNDRADAENSYQLARLNGASRNVGGPVYCESCLRFLFFLRLGPSVSTCLLLCPYDLSSAYQQLAPDDGQ